MPQGLQAPMTFSIRQFACLEKIHPCPYYRIFAYKTLPTPNPIPDRGILLACALQKQRIMLSGNTTGGQNLLIWPSRYPPVKVVDQPVEYHLMNTLDNPHVVDVYMKVMVCNGFELAT